MWRILLSTTALATSSKQRLLSVHLFRAYVFMLSLKENFDIILAHLSERGDVTVGQGRNGEQILKFRVGSFGHIVFITLFFIVL